MDYLIIILIIIKTVFTHTNDMTHELNNKDRYVSTL